MHMKNEVKPISPQDLRGQVEHAIHPSMIRAVNVLLTRFDGYSLTLTQEEIIEKFLELEPTISEDEIFQKKWLDFEGMYRREGWSVVYDKPGYNESYRPYYTFMLAK